MFYINKLLNTKKNYTYIISDGKPSIDILSKCELKFWQRVLDSEIEHPPIPEIIWYVGEFNGKTAMGKYLEHNYGAAYYTIADNIADLYSGEKIVVIDLEKIMPDIKHYNIIRDVKDGMLITSDHKMKNFIYSGDRTVIVFSRYLPNTIKCGNIFDIRIL